MKSPGDEARHARPEREQASVPGAVETMLESAMAHHRAGELAQAEALYREGLRLSPAHPVALHLLGVVASQVGQHTVAVEFFDQAIAASPEFAEAHCSRGNALYVLGQYQSAVESYGRAMALNPQHAEASNNRGSALHALGEYERAVESYEHAIGLNPGYVEAHNNRGNTLHVLGRYSEAVSSYDCALAINPDYGVAWSSRGATLHALGEDEAAIASYDRALALDSNDAGAWSNRADALQSLGRYPEALASCERALALNPNFADAWCNRATALHALQDYLAALEGADRAIALNPSHVEAHNNRGGALFALAQFQAAIESFDRAIALKPSYAEAHANRGNVAQILKRYDQAAGSYSQALRLNPGHPYLPGMLLHARRFLCDWDGIDAATKRLEASIDGIARVVLPFAALSLSESPEMQRLAAQAYAADVAPPQIVVTPAQLTVGSVPLRPRSGRIRVGYFSADYYNHATSYLIAELLERHDRERFEVLAFSFGPPVVDDWTRRVATAVDRFIDVGSMTDAEVAELSRKLEVDIAIDLKGFTRDCRAGIFARRAAPIQVNYLGYPGTMAASWMDYLIADPTVIPDARRRDYSEKIVYLPDTYQANCSRRSVAETPRSRAEEGLPEAVFVFCCFNTVYKISPAVFDLWMRILAQVPGSVLWLLEDNPWATENLRRRAAQHGIARGRLLFAPQTDIADHLARAGLADLFLDTFPYGAHTTASDALWAGLPVLTRMGETFASRVAASLLRAVGLPGFVTNSEAEYEALAVGLARDPERCQALRERLRENRDLAPLFDTRRFTRHLEAAYATMAHRYHVGLPPEDIRVTLLGPASGAARNSVHPRKRV